MKHHETNLSCMVLFSLFYMFFFMVCQIWLHIPQRWLRLRSLRPCVPGPPGRPGEMAVVVSGYGDISWVWFVAKRIVGRFGAVNWIWFWTVRLCIWRVWVDVGCTVSVSLLFLELSIMTQEQRSNCRCHPLGELGPKINSSSHAGSATSSSIDFEGSRSWTNFLMIEFNWWKKWLNMIKH